MLQSAGGNLFTGRGYRRGGIIVAPPRVGCEITPPRLSAAGKATSPGAECGARSDTRPPSSQRCASPQRVTEARCASRPCAGAAVAREPGTSQLALLPPRQAAGAGAGSALRPGGTRTGSAVSYRGPRPGEGRSRGVATSRSSGRPRPRRQAVPRGPPLHAPASSYPL